MAITSEYSSYQYPYSFGSLTAKGGAKVATGEINNPFALGATSKVGALNQNEMAYVTRPQNESRELENSDISGSHLGAKLDLQGCENKAWGKDLEWV